MKTFKVVWTDVENVFEKVIGNQAEGLQLIQQVELPKAAAIPPMIEFSVPDREMSLTLGVGRSDTVLTFNESLEPPYFISLGNSAEIGVITFCWGNQETEYLKRNSVPFAKGLEALSFFLNHLSRPPNLDWERL